jgi:hypothetical protein
MEQVMPLWSSRRWNCSLVCCDPWSEWWSRASALPRRQTAIIRASLTSEASRSAFIDQPTTRREKRSSTTET